MGASRYVGRVGVLAVALGVGAGVTLGIGTAWADETAGSAGGSGSPGSGTPDKPASQHAAKSDSPANSVANGPEKPAGSPEKPKGKSKGKPKGANKHRGVSADTPSSDDPAADKPPAPKSVAAKPTAQAAARPAPVSTAAVSVTASPSPAPVAPPALAGPVSAPVVDVPSVVSPAAVALSSTAGVLSTLLGGTGGTPAATPLTWVLAAAARRELGLAPTASIATPTTPTPIAATATVNQPPTVVATVATPDANTGVVTGKITATDPEKKALTYAVASPPTTGTLVFDTKKATFTYTPTTAQRVLAGLQPDAVTVTFTVAVSDGVNTTNTDVPVTVSPITIADAGAIHAGSSPSGVVASNTRAYVSNVGDNTITVIDTVNKTVVGSITLDSQAVGSAISKDGKKLYVATAERDAVTVVNTSTSTIASYVELHGQYADLLTVSPDGKTLYALTDDETGATPVAKVTKISTATNKVTGAVALPGAILTFDDNFDITSFYDIVVTPDSKKVYVIADLEADPVSGDVPSGLFTFTSTAKTATLMGTAAYAIDAEVSPDGKRLYVDDIVAESILVYDTATNTVIDSFDNPGGTLGGMTLSGDGSVLLAVNDDHVVAFDTTTGDYTTLVSTATGTTNTEFYPGTALSPDGQALYYTADDGALQVISLANTAAKRAIPAPVLGAANPVTGAVTGTVTDAAGKKLTYTLVTAPTDGTLNVNKTTGAFTYTPTAAQRVLAALDPDARSAVFTLTVSDGKTTVPVAVTVPISPITVAALGNVGVSDHPWSIAVTNTRAYISDTVGGSITVIDTIHGTALDPIVVGSPTSGLAVSSDGKRLFVGSITNNEVLVYDTATGTVSHTTALPGKEPVSMALSPNGKTLYVGTIAVDANGQPAVDANGNHIGGIRRQDLHDQLQGHGHGHRRRRCPVVHHHSTQRQEGVRLRDRLERRHGAVHRRALRVLVRRQQGHAHSGRRYQSDRHGGQPGQLETVCQWH